MKITVLNGSPKGGNSVTMQYVKYMQQQFAQHEFNILNVAQEIGRIEMDPERFSGIVSEVETADGVLWAFPLYVCAVHANYMRFIELISERRAEAAFRGKYAAALSTSIHFFDHTAHAYIRAVCDDLGMKYAGFFSAEMEDLMKEQGRAGLTYFTRDFLSHIERGLPTQRLYAPADAPVKPYSSGLTGTKEDNAGIKALIIADIAEADGNLAAMVDRLKNAFSEQPEVVNLRKISIKGGCLGCIKCGFDNRCVYGGSDDIKELYDDKLKNADIVIYAGALHGRFLSSRFKTFMDRRFMHTHQPLLTGKQVAWLVSGPLGQNHNITEILQAVSELDEANLAGIVTDEEGGSADIDARLNSLASELVQAAKAGYVRPATFLGVGGRKLFRDEIYGHLRFTFQGDHKYYRKHGMYDFPQKQIGMRLGVLGMTLFSKIPQVRKNIRENIPKYMLMPYQKVLGETKE